MNGNAYYAAPGDSVKVDVYDGYADVVVWYYDDEQERKTIASLENVDVCEFSMVAYPVTIELKDAQV